MYHELKQDSCYKFADEFFELKEVGRDQPSEASLIPANRGKNRYTNILAYDRSRGIFFLIYFDLKSATKSTRFNLVFSLTQCYGRRSRVRLYQRKLYCRE